MAIFNTVYGGEWKWKPWANTIAYYPLNWNLNDSSGNWYNSIASWWTLSYPSNKYLQLSSWYSRFQSPLWWWVLTSELTISVWEKDIPYNSENTIFCIWVDGISGSWWCYRLLWNNWGYKVWTTNGITWIETSVYPTTSWIWHHLVAILKPSNYIKIYIDGTLKETKTISYNPRNPWWYMALWQTTTSQSISWYLDEIILENKERTAEKISKYYKSTKWNY